MMNIEEMKLLAERRQRQFLELLTHLTRLFPRESLSQYQQYLDAGEYGLALDEAQWIFDQAKREQDVTAPILQLMKELAGEMRVQLHEPFASMVR